MTLRRQNLLKIASYLLAGLVLLLNSGCGINRLPYHRQMESLPDAPVCRVAVLPFLNDSDFPKAGTILKKVFGAQLQRATDYQIVPDGDVIKSYQKLHILPGMVPTLEQMQIIANHVSAQLLITGIIMEMREDPGEHRTLNPMIIMEVQIRDGRNGETLWTTFHRRQGTDYKKAMHFGTLHTVTGLSQQMAEEIITLWMKKGLPQCNVLSQL